MTIQDKRDVDVLAELVRRRAADDVATMDYRRSLVRAAATHTQTEVAKVLHVSQPALSQQLKTAKKTPEVAEGFSGAGTYEICQRYAAEEIGRERLIDELARWPYTPMPEADPWEDVVLSPGPGSWREVVRAFREGLIDGATYDEVQRRRFPGVA